MNIKKILAVALSATLFLSLFSGCAGTEGDDTTSVASFQLPSVAPASDAESSNTTTEIPNGAESDAEKSSSDYTNYSNYTAFTSNMDNAPDINNIVLTVDPDVYSTSVTELDINIANRTGWEIVYAEAFIVEKLSGDAWVQLPFKDGAEPFKNSYPLGNNRETTQTVDLTRLRDGLSVGVYRVGIHMICNGYAGDFYRTVEFSIK